ncbi:hypothetical protein AFNJKBDN_CDS0046 [Halorubrum virus V_ICIS4]|nr:hypothetical protein AFNJKBDN_CDS0046 [Halorubrum virus V_ICIS4]
MDIDDLSDDQLDDLATKLAPRFPTGSHGDRVVLTKRQFMGAATGVLSAGALMALGVDEAAAQAAGRQGTPSEPNNMYAYDLNVANAVTSSLPMGGNDIENAGSVSTENLNTEYHYAGAYPGSDVDARLDNALSAASDGHIIYLEDGKYSNNRTISKATTIIGDESMTAAGPTLEAVWTVSNRNALRGLFIGAGGKLILDNERIKVSGIIDFGDGVTVSANDCAVVLGASVSVTFNSGTSGGLADSLWGGSSVTDNGTNLEGDVT